jgi:hypothetical protein
MKQALFTIVSKNYIGLAGVLEASVKAHTPGCDFFIVVADEWDQNQQMPQLPANVLIAREVLDIDAALWERLSFQYSLVEFCTAIKASAFRFFFEQKDYEKVIYLDPDIFAYSGLQPVFDRLANRSILVTPHIMRMQTKFTGDYPDYLFLVNGMFNLGFLALKNIEASAAMLRWWERRLFDECYFDNDRGLATDQKWMNFLPCFFESSELEVVREPGWNMAPWNFYEREIVLQPQGFGVTNRLNEKDAAPTPLLFIHFSGYDYRGFVEGRVAHKKEDFNTYPDLSPVFDAYADALRNSRFAEFIGLPYSYACFENGVQILAFNRRLFRRLGEEGEIFPAPFSTGKDSFFELLRRKKLLDYETAAADKVTNKSISGYDKKLGYVHLLFRTMKKLMGVRRYSMLVRMFKRYAREENHVFLADKEIGRKLQ